MNIDFVMRPCIYAALRAMMGASRTTAARNRKLLGNVNISYDFPIRSAGCAALCGNQNVNILTVARFYCAAFYSCGSTGTAQQNVPKRQNVNILTANAELLCGCQAP